MNLMKKTFIILSCLYVTSCSHTNHQKAHHVTERPYRVFGVKYYPQASYDYDKVGYASWYGEGDHGKPTATGVTFNKYVMTAAHRTLPLPSVVKVTNLENNKSIIVLINDRGPFAKTSKRIIDLSEAAAKKLGCHYKGEVKVRVQCLRDESIAAALAYNKKPYDIATYKHYAMVDTKISQFPTKKNSQMLIASSASVSKPVHTIAPKNDFISFNTISEKIKALFGITTKKASVTHVSASRSAATKPTKRIVRSSIANRIMY